MLPPVLSVGAMADIGHPSTFSYTNRNSPAAFRDSDEVLAKVPVIGMIRQSFLFSGGYTADLSIKELRIDHMVSRSRCPQRNRACLFALSYSQPIGQNLFSSRFDFPLLSSETLGGYWGPASVGDYVVHLANTPLTSPVLMLFATARF